jgi:hypothetical protein
MHSRRARSWTVWALIACAACSGGDDPGRAGEPTSGGSGDAARTGTTNSGCGGKAGSGGIDSNPGLAGQWSAAGNPGLAGAAGMSAPPDFSCAKRTEEGRRVPVDMYIMLDRSDSMSGVTGTGETKWDAMRAALTRFVSDPRSAGLSVGLQYFPLGKAGVPTQCTTDAECGQGAPCRTRLCQPPPGVTMFQPIFCTSNAQCPADSPGCIDFGVCSRNDALVCFEPGVRRACALDGDCLDVISVCEGYASCAVADYATPAVPIAELPGAAGQISASLAAATPIGLTPTSAALQGALQQARERATAEPTHRVIAVLATDGLPTDCAPTDVEGVADIARVAFAGDPKLATYVIGVFSPEETDARTNLDIWARAGGTPGAFILDPTQDVNAQFIDALEKIRGGTLACEYMLPPSPEGNELDLGLVNVEVVSDSMTRPLRYVGDAGSCGRAEFGWHYDADPATGKATKIVTCSTTCDLLKTTSGKVEIKLGCKTLGPD